MRGRRQLGDRPPEDGNARILRRRRGRACGSRFQPVEQGGEFQNQEAPLNHSGPPKDGGSACPTLRVGVIDSRLHAARDDIPSLAKPAAADQSLIQ